MDSGAAVEWGSGEELFGVTVGSWREPRTPFVTDTTALQGASMHFPIARTLPAS